MEQESLSMQDMILNLQNYWAKQGCSIICPIDIEVGAGTFHPMTFLRSLGPEPNNAAYLQPSRRPTDGRYGKNPNRLQHYYQFQVVLKPAPNNIQDLYLNSLKILGIDKGKHDIRFVEDNWESPTLGAWGMGWEVWLDGMEISQFTYFQQVGGFSCKPITGEITYGVERLATYIQDKSSVYDLIFNKTPNRTVYYKDLFLENEKEHSKYNFEQADEKKLFEIFDFYKNEIFRLVKQDLALVAYEMVLKASHIFNILDARGAIGVNLRQEYILQIRKGAKSCACCYLEKRKKLNYPLLEKK